MKLKKTGLNLYHIDDKYITFLKNSGNNSVESNYAKADNQKPYIGVVFQVNNHNYFAPLSSPKEKYKAMSYSNPTLFKIEKGSNKKLIGVVRLNNMIPVPDMALIRVDFAKVKDLEYKNLLESQYRIMQNNLSNIKDKAQSIYDLVVNKKNDFYRNLSNDFTKLEKDCNHFSSNAISANSNTYDVKFCYNKDSNAYSVSINGESGKEFIEKNPQALSVIQNHPDIKKHNVPLSELKEGVITKVDSMKGGNRPQDMKLNAAGQEIKQVKEQAQGMER